VPLGLLTMGVGVRAYYRMKRRIAILNHAMPEAPEGADEE
jgi:hypothetical protein